jgi:hypothetical protein
MFSWLRFKNDVNQVQSQSNKKNIEYSDAKILDVLKRQEIEQKIKDNTPSECVQALASFGDDRRFRELVGYGMPGGAISGAATGAVITSAESGCTVEVVASAAIGCATGSIVGGLIIPIACCFFSGHVEEKLKEVEELKRELKNYPVPGLSMQK